LLFIFAITSRGPMVLMSSDLTLSPATAVELYCLRPRIEIYQPYNLHKSLSAINRWWQAIAHDLWRRALTATVPVRSYPLG